jgi:hypothetical protein
VHVRCSLGCGDISTATCVAVCMQGHIRCNGLSTLRDESCTALRTTRWCPKPQCIAVKNATSGLNATPVCACVLPVERLLLKFTLILGLLPLAFACLLLQEGAAPQGPAYACSFSMCPFRLVAKDNLVCLLQNSARSALMHCCRTAFSRGCWLHCHRTPHAAAAAAAVRSLA